MFFVPDLKCVYPPLFIGVFQEWTIGVKPIVFAIHQIARQLYANARKYYTNINRVVILSSFVRFVLLNLLTW